ncbi:uncharacterized protein LOC128412410 [Podarcis raffonei]|uniref:uncharacterized protein LOC128412410 n=1 Tax=Podarcis raffonei TaxID=65483 RepID=UPI0023295C07|nr:uncharacterized protein LOC128412410 [Podarcis raffonei]
MNLLREDAAQLQVEQKVPLSSDREASPLRRGQVQVEGLPWFRCLRRLISCNKVAPLEVLEQPAVSDVLGIDIPSIALLDKDQLYLLGIIQACQAARLRGLRTLKYSKEETAKAILDILGHLEYFRDRPLSLALAFETLLQLSFMRPQFSPSMVSAILHRTTEAVLGSADEDKEELKRPFQSLLGGFLLEAPNTGSLLQLLTDLRYYALLGSEDQRKLAASSISLLLALSRRFPNLRNTVIRPELACFRNNLKEGKPHTLGTVNSLVPCLPKTHLPGLLAGSPAGPAPCLASLSHLAWEGSTQTESSYKKRRGLN